MTVVDTVLMGRHPHSKWGSLNRDLEHVYNTLKLMGIEDLAMRPFNELSAGQTQKVMLARGIAQEPKILLLDEPTSNLDIKHQLEVTRILRELSRKNNILVIMISHDINIASKYSDLMILMHEGKIFSVGRPQEVITENNLLTVYGVNAKVIIDEGRPHAILRDPDVPSPLQEDAGHSVQTPEAKGVALPI
jgi:iron complex transport system ATP-binding protein